MGKYIPILVFCGIILQSYIVPLFYHLLLTPKYSGIKYIFMWGISAFQIALTRTFLFDTPLGQVMNFAISVAVWLVILQWGYQESLWKDIFAVILGNSCLVAADVEVLILRMLVGLPIDIDMTLYTTDRLAMMLLGAIFACVTAMTELYFAKKLMKKQNTPGLLIMILQLLANVLLSTGGHLTLLVNGVNPSLWQLSASVMLNLTTVYWIWSVLQKSHQMELESAIEELEKQMAENHNYYHAIEQKREAIAKLRHDMNNQILVAKHLIENEDVEEAEALLRQLSGALNMTK